MKKVTVNVGVRTEHRGRKRLGRAGGAPNAESPASEKIPRVARVLALAHHWQGLIRSGAVRDQADIARLVGVSRSRVTQVMNLLWLAPDIQEEILFARDKGPGHGGLRGLAALPLWAEQRAAWDRRSSPVAARGGAR